MKAVDNEQMMVNAAKTDRVNANIAFDRDNTVFMFKEMNKRWQNWPQLKKTRHGQYKDEAGTGFQLPDGACSTEFS